MLPSWQGEESRSSIISLSLYTREIPIFRYPSQLRDGFISGVNYARGDDDEDDALHFIRNSSSEVTGMIHTRFLGLIHAFRLFSVDREPKMGSHHGNVGIILYICKHLKQICQPTLLFISTTELP